MKTFEIEITNLGPIRSATFSASHFNLICGKNNSGKSMCLHSVFCFLSKWRSKIHLSAGGELAEEVVQKTRVKFDALQFVERLNPALASSSDEFSKHLYEFLNKSQEQLNDCKVVFQMNPAYIRDRLQHSNVNVFLSITPTSKLVLRKEFNTTESVFIVENSGGGEFPEKGLVAAAINRLIDYLLVEMVLPRPYLMTAERSGSILYGDDLRTKSFLDQVSQPKKVVEAGAVSARYAYPYVQELKDFWDAQSNPVAAPSDLEKVMMPSDNVSESFGENVALGTYKEHDGKIYYQPQGDAREFRLSEVSTSVRALMQLDHFVKRSYRERNLLLMMDEPELNLHPERQRALARFLVLLMRMRGVGVAISTHSDYLVKEINTLLMFGSGDASTAAIMQRYGYQESEVLRTEDVACGVAEDQTIKTYEPSKEDGFALPNFDTTIELMNEIQDAIRWEDKA